MHAGLSALQRTHEVYRLAREKIEARDKADEEARLTGNHDTSTRRTVATPSTVAGARESARAVAERELTESLRKVRAAQAGQAVAGRRAAAEREQLQAALREAREVAAQQAAYSREELLQERQRRAKLESERQAEAANSEVQLLTAEQRLQTQAASSKRETSTLEAMLIEAQSRIEALELELHARSAELADARMALTEAHDALMQERMALAEERGRYASLSAAMAEAEAEAVAAIRAAEAASQAQMVPKAEAETSAEGGPRVEAEAHNVKSANVPPRTPATPAVRQRAVHGDELPSYPADETLPPASAHTLSGPSAFEVTEPARSTAPAKADTTNAQVESRVVSSMTSSFSLFGAGLASPANDGKSLLVFGGGGGASKTGVPNALVVTKLRSSFEMELVGEHRTGLAPVQSLALSTSGERLVALQGSDVVIYDEVSRPNEQPEGTSWEKIATVDKKRPPPSPMYSPPTIILRGPPPDPEADGIRKPRKPEVYSLAMSPCGKKVAIGIDDGTFVFLHQTSEGTGGMAPISKVGADYAGQDALASSGVGGPGCTPTGAGGWVEVFRAQRHARDLKSLCFSHDGELVATAADDDVCLVWPVSHAIMSGGVPTSTAVPQPRFILHNLVTPVPKRRGKPLPRTAAWRCIVFAPPDGSGASIAGGVLYGALNHAAGIGWLARVGISTGGKTAEVLKHVKVTPQRLTSIALSGDGAIVAAGTNEGEVVLHQAKSLQRLMKLQEHQMYVAVLVLTQADTEGGYAAISCSTNEVKVTRIRKDQLKAPVFSGTVLWIAILSMFIVLLAAILAH